ncbi:MAG: hypothetical protein ACRDJ9_35645, partial [Dehalococcoidia bacterium]
MWGRLWEAHVGTTRFDHLVRWWGRLRTAAGQGVRSYPASCGACETLLLSQGRMWTGRVGHWSPHSAIRRRASVAAP